MPAISDKMLSMLERLAEFFPKSSYQTRLERYLNNKFITDPVQLEHYIRQFEQKGK